LTGLNVSRSGQSATSKRQATLRGKFGDRRITAEQSQQAWNGA
jgi:hypothetical protein